VNKTETRVELLWDPSRSECLDERQKRRVIRSVKGRLTGEGILVMASDATRSQIQNKRDVTERFLTLVEQGLTPRKKRIPTRPTTGSREKRLKDKKTRSEIKKLRRKRPDRDG